MKSLIKNNNINLKYNVCVFFKTFFRDLHDLSKDRFYTQVYIKSHMRSMTYFVGILAGYLYMRLKEADFKFSLV